MPGGEDGFRGQCNRDEVFMAEHAMDDATCRRVQAAMDAGVREPTEVIDDEMELRRRRPSRLAYRGAAGGLRADRSHLDAQREAIGAFFERELDGREGVNLLRYEPGGFYKPHADSADMPAWPPAARRAVTVVLFLESSREADPAGGFSGGIFDCSRRRWHCQSRSSRGAGCSSAFPPTRCTRSRRSSTVIGIRSSTGFRDRRAAEGLGLP